MTEIAPPDDPPFDVEGLTLESVTLRVALSFDELLAMAELLGLDGFPGVPDDMFDGLPNELRDAMLGTASRSLIAHRIVRVHDEDEGTVELVQPYAGIISAVISPDAVLTGQQQVGEEAETRVIYVQDDLVVEQSSPLDLIQEFALLDAADLLPYALDLGGERPASSTGHELNITAGQLDQLEDLLAADDIDGALTLVPDARPFVEALFSTRRFNHLEALHRDGEAVAGGELTWVDGGEHGLWQIDVVDDEASESRANPLLVIRSVTADELISQLRAFLPDTLDIG